MIIYLYGPDTYRRQRRVDVLRDGFIQKYDELGTNVASIHGSTFTIDEFRKHTKSVGLFSSKRFLLFTDIWALAKEQQDQLKEELRSLDNDIILCISTDAPQRKNNGLHTTLLQSDVVEEYIDLPASQVQQFIVEESTKYNGSIDSVAVRELQERVGSDLWRLHYEVKKLCHMNTTITADMVVEHVEAPFNDTIFALTDAVGKKDAARATILLDKLMANGEPVQYILRMLSQHFSTLVQVKKSGTEASSLGLHSFVLQKAQAQCAQFTTQALLQLHWRLLEIDQESKTGSDPVTLLHLFIVRACS